MTEAKYLRLGDEQFRAVDELPAWSLMRLAKGQQSGDVMTLMAGMYDFMSAIVVPKERARMGAYLDEHGLSEDDLDHAIGALMEEYSVGPTQRPSRSPAGPPPTGGSSRAASSSPATDAAESPSSAAGERVPS